jgi:hypothetical protein
MSVFRNAKKIISGALHDEDEDSDDRSSDEERDSEEEGDSENENEDSGDDDSDEDGRSKKKHKSSEELVEAGLKWVKPGKAGEAGSDDDSEESAGEEENDDAEREIEFPCRCSLCTKTFFNMEQLVAHMKSKGHLKKQKGYDLGVKKFFRKPDQVAKLKERNRRKKERKIAQKKTEKSATGHVWGEHKKPPKSAEQRAAEAAAMKAKKPLAPAKPKDKRTRGEKRRDKRLKEEQREPKKEQVGGGGRTRPGDKSDWDSLPKQQGKRKNRA